MGVLAPIGMSGDDAAGATTECGDPGAGAGDVGSGALSEERAAGSYCGALVCESAGAGEGGSGWESDCLLPSCGVRKPAWTRGVLEDAEEDAVDPLA